MRHGFRNTTLFLFLALLLCFGGSAAAQQGFDFEDFSNTDYANQHLFQNYSQKYTGRNGNLPYLTTYQGNYVLRLTDGGSNYKEASSVYFNEPQAVLGFTTWFKFQAHRPLGCCNPGDGIAFIIQNSSAPDMSMGATEPMGAITALGAGGNTQYPYQAGALGYAGIDNSLVIEFDTAQDPWDPNGNHIAIQTCGTGVNTPVHDSGTYQIGYNPNVSSCLYVHNNVPAITMPAQLGGSCIPGVNLCSDGAVHNVVIMYSPPSQPGLQGSLVVYLDPQFIPGTHTPEPTSTPALSIPYTLALNLGSQQPPCLPGIPCSALVGFTASQPGETGYTADAAQDILGWSFDPTQITQPVPPGGIQNMFNFGPHMYGVTYPTGFMPPSGLLMTVLSTPDRPQPVLPDTLARNRVRK